MKWLRNARVLANKLILVLVLANACLSGDNTVVAQDAENKLQLSLRFRERESDSAHPGTVRIRAETWRASETAIVVCDMWDRHHSLNATRRVGELAEHINRVVNRARDEGVTIIHAPSSCMNAYDGHPARLRAIHAPRADNLPAGIDSWCDWLSEEEKQAYPIDQSDGGVDDDLAEGNAWHEKLVKEGRNPNAPWQRQIESIRIDERDVITDNGTENWNVQEHLGIKNVLVVGVHTNMCVLGRPFGLRQMAKNGRNVALVRDLTDTMYNPAREPKVNHFSGTDLIVAHIEKFVCPTMTSDQIGGDGLAFRFKNDDRKHLVAILAEDEYQTRRTIPEFALKHLGQDFRVSYVFSDPKVRDQLCGLEAIKSADVLLLSMRRRALPKTQLDLIRSYVTTGKSVVALRTSSHAFSLRPGMKMPAGGQQWPEFDQEVLGGNYTGHHGNKDGKVKTFVKIVNQAKDHPIMAGVDLGEIEVASWLYKTSPLAEQAEVLMTGRVEGREPAEPVAWTNISATGSRVFYTSLGHPDDFKQRFFQRLLTNGVYWAAGIETANSSAKPEVQQDSPEFSAKTSAGASKAKFSLRQVDTAELEVVDDLELDLLVQEPIVANPLYINFDERGRMWVVQYRQYPSPAGLKLISRDNVWRNVYDPPSPPPPPHPRGSPFRGNDRITIHEDSNGDGRFDSHKVFLDGLNFATAALKGRGGVFVMNPPYLLFYADKNNDDVPDQDKPEILLSGFGIEDSHSIANSLRWGPDGWIYATQGSTVSASVIRYDAAGKPFPDEEPIHSVGQNIWRYHPETRRYEIFAEGGGNAFGVEFDDIGYVYSGHNGGDTRGFHYVQGGYYLKNFGKHGSLSNPFAFAHFPSMKNNNSPRFTHTFEIYQSTELPQRYHNRMFAIAPNLHHLILSDVFADGSTRRTEDIAELVVPGDGERASWFTPVDIQTGPDGALYIADWFSVQPNHYKNHEGETNPDLGRIYRLRGRDYKPLAPFDLSQLTNEQLIDQYLVHPNRWFRETALRILGDRKAEELVFKLLTIVDEDQPHSLEALWALHQIVGMDEVAGLVGIGNPNPNVRRWTIRLIGDRVEDLRKLGTERVLYAITGYGNDLDPAVRSQLASTAKKFDTELALLTITNLLSNSDNTSDLHIPNLIWWALEKHSHNHQQILESLEQNSIWWTNQIRIDGMSLPECLARRWGMQNTPNSLSACARLLQVAPEDDRPALVRGIANAFEGLSSIAIPTELATELGKSQNFYTRLLKIRQHDLDEIEWALDTIEREINKKTDSQNEVLLLIQVLGEVLSSQAAESVQIGRRLEAFLKSSTDSQISRALLSAIQRFDHPLVALTVIEQLPNWSLETQKIAVSTLASRSDWALSLVKGLEMRQIQPESFEQNTIERLRLHNRSELKQLLQKHFPNNENRDSNKIINQRIEAVAKVILASRGDPLEGRKTFESETTSCAKCHRMFDRGGEIGPDLTAYNRSNVNNMLLSILNPSVEIREGFEPWTIFTEDGRLLSGFKLSENEHSVTLREATGQTVVIARDEIEEMQPSKRSLMPDGLLDGLTDQQICDLFAYLSSTSPPM